MGKHARRVLGLTHVVVLLAGLVCSSAVALAADRFVSTTGSDTANDCTNAANPCATIMYTVSQAVSGDTLKVAGGVYPASAKIQGYTAQILTVSGGWSSDFTARSLATNPTTLNRFGAGAGPSEVVDITIDGVIFIGDGSGASVSGDGSLTLSLVNTRITKTKDSSGLSVLARDSGQIVLNVTNSTFDKNVTDLGGAMYISTEDSGSVSGTFMGSSFVKNKARGGGSGSGAYDGEGGAVDVLALQASTVQLSFTDSTFTQNKSIGQGGAFLVQGLSTSTVDVSFTRNTFTKNRATSGGALYASSRSSSGVTMTVDDSLLLSNGAKDGGASRITCAEDFGISGLVTFNVRNSIVALNKAKTFSGGLELIAFQTGTLVSSIESSTITGNRGLDGGGIDANCKDSGSTTVSLKNTILDGNSVSKGGTAADFRAFQVAGTLIVNADHDDLGDVLLIGSPTYNDQGGNISAVPLFVNAKKDFHLTSASPAIDAGTCTGAPPADFEGDPRPSGAGCDIGADERVP